MFLGGLRTLLGCVWEGFEAVRFECFGWCDGDGTCSREPGLL